MARRKKTQEEANNHERWMVSYADFLTLLFAFFVVMYAVSSVNEGKYRTLSHSLIAAFHTPARTIEPIQIGELARTREQVALALDVVPRNMPLPDHMVDRVDIPTGITINDGDVLNASPELGGALQRMTEQVVVALRPLIESELITVRRTELWMEIELSTSILFASGSGELNPQAVPVLHQIAQILKPFPNPIRVEGFTDNNPINTWLYPSNWELSAARAARVVRLFAEEGIAPERLAAVGFGEYRPVADNASAQGRSQNRRVALVVLATPDSRYEMDVLREESTVRLSEVGLPPPPASGAQP